MLPKDKGGVVDNELKVWSCQLPAHFLYRLSFPGVWHVKYSGRWSISGASANCDSNIRCVRWPEIQSSADIIAYSNRICHWYAGWVRVHLLEQRKAHEYILPSSRRYYTRKNQTSQVNTTWANRCPTTLFLPQIQAQGFFFSTRVSGHVYVGYCEYTCIICVVVFAETNETNAV